MEASKKHCEEWFHFTHARVVSSMEKKKKKRRRKGVVVVVE